MPEPFRGPKISRRSWLLAGLTAPLFSAKGADSLIVTFDGDNLHVSSLGVHFLQNASLNRLKEGSTVEYVLTVSLFRDQFVTQFKRFEGHFFISYDVWGSGDQFAVYTKGTPPVRRANLSQSATETWCLEHVGISATGLAKDSQFWLQLESRTVPPKISGVLAPTGVNVNLIEIFTPGDEERQVHRSGLLRLMDLRGAGRGHAG